MNENTKPYVVLSAAMTIDGKIASRGGDPELSDEEDWIEVHKLRKECDAIMVGKNTIFTDDPKLRIKYHEHQGCYRIIVDSNLSIPISSKVISYKPETYPTIICTTENISKKKLEKFREKNVEIIQAGKGERVDLIQLMPLLYQKGIKSLLLEGGGTLNWSFFNNGLVDELRITIAPWIIGGKDAISLVEGKGFYKMKQGVKFRLIDVKSRDNYVSLRYKRREK
ncbi:MAG: 2,5-diamino-6-ribosylamino-4(3H)-pyrimidinone 5'-phosphate reductase [Promethearchaeota archaeon]|nr:MAG: 2,5-diamino-6-ribosylamino-4(3H)-pyrimidinone 5'-phosphate reductase [Candidatus Lokiarchaeota archaeon]